MHLYIYTADDKLRAYLQQQIVNRRSTDSGFDIPMLNNQSGNRTKVMTFDFQMIVAATDDLGNPEPLLLVPRSSIANSPFRLANSIGLIDMGYRGSLKAKVDIIEQCDYLMIHDGTRYFQLCRQNWMPWKNITLVSRESDLPPAPDSRGSGGFGSTGH